MTKLDEASRYKFVICSIALGLSIACAPRSSELDRAVMLSSKGRDREAIAVVEADLGKHPNSVEDPRILVRLYAVTGDLGSAERTAGALAARLPGGSPIPWLELGHALEIAHRYDEALALYDKAAAVAPHDPSGPRTGGLRAARWGEAEWAAPRLEEALRRAPGDATVWHALGLVRLELGEFEAARQAYESGLAANPDALENRLGLATLALKQGEPARALAEYDAVLARRPSFREGYLGRSWALIRLGRLDDGATALDEARRRGADPRAIAAQARLIAKIRTARSTKK